MGAICVIAFRRIQFGSGVPWGRWSGEGGGGGGGGRAGERDFQMAELG